MKLRALPAFNDNYIWMVDHLGHALVVDPGDAQPVLQVLQGEGLQLDAILVTHHHPDHTGGVDVLRNTTGAVVYGPARENIPLPFEPLFEGTSVHTLGLDFQVLDVPGHTAGHIAFYCPAFSDAPLLFCGDTLFSAGCGRLFEGTAEQLYLSLQKFTAMPDSTQVCCTHEYTLSNLRFALAVEPGNRALHSHHEHCRQLRENALPTLPSNMGLEKAINPFLRAHVPAVQSAAREHAPQAHTTTEVFAALRAWKNTF
jgi:hydroxyacylglutathione hydrolase